MFELPVVQGLVVCRRVDIDPATGLPTLVNRLTRVRVGGFPSRPVRLAVFAALSDGDGDIPVLLTIRHLGTDAEVTRHRTVLRFGDRLREVLLHVDFARLVFPNPGAYEIALFAGDEPLASYRLLVAPKRPEVES